MRDAWKAAVEKAFPAGHAAGFPGYPLLGGELAERPGESRAPWRLRLTLRAAFEPDQLMALLEDVEEVCLLDEAASLRSQIGEKELYGEGGAWTLRERHESSLGPLSGERSIWTGPGGERVEQTVFADGMLLRNLALLRSAPRLEPEVSRWLVSSAVSADGETEGLIADTLAYWTGAVGGADVLEVAQRPGEGFETLWARLNICRLLRWEAALGQPGDPLAGAGLFHDLSALATTAD